MNNRALDIFKIKDGELGIVNINNMIPSPKSCLTEVLPLVKDKQYKNLLPKRIMDRCRDFNLLEKKCRQYEKEEVSV